jgi:putative DNA primase/helicase
MLFLSSGEKTLAEHVSSGTVNADIKAGVEQRMIQLNAEDAGRGMGVFENIHGCATPADFADLLTKQNTSKYQGVAGPAWAAWLIDHEPDAVRRMDEMISAFKQRVIPVGASGEIHRAARIFAVVGAAGELATEAGITGWDRGAALSAAEWAFHRWLTTRPSLGASDLDKAIRRLQAYIVEHSDNRFEDLDTPPDPGRPMNDRVGFREVDRTTGELEYFIQTPQLEEIVGGRVDSLVQELNARGYLRTSGDRLQVKKRIAALSKNPMWFYVLREALFHAGEVRSTGAVAAQEVTV